MKKIALNPNYSKIGTNEILRAIKYLSNNLQNVDIDMMMACDVLEIRESLKELVDSSLFEKWGV